MTDKSIDLTAKHGSRQPGAPMSIKRFLGDALLGILLGISCVTVVFLGTEQVSWQLVLKAVTFPAVAAFLRSPKREALAVLWLSPTGALMIFAMVSGDVPMSVSRLVFAVALLGLAWGAFHRGKRIAQQVSTPDVRP